jgi:hypothetical protein
VKAMKSIIVALMFCLLAGQAVAEEKAPLVIGENLKVGMQVSQVITLMGIPDKFTVNRGTEPLTDSVVIEYLNQGVVVHAVNKSTLVDEIEILPTFKGSFAKGVKIGAKFNDLVAKYGVPKTMNAQIARYPEQGMFFQLEKESLVSAKVFRKNSQILDLKLINRH